MITDLDGANCVGKHDLFDSMNALAHRSAKALCDDCPARLACAQLVRGERERLGTPTGTWAGRLVGSRGGRPHGNAKPREHGTKRGYEQHRYRNETPCAGCKQAVRDYFDQHVTPRKSA